MTSNISIHAGNALLLLSALLANARGSDTGIAGCMATACHGSNVPAAPIWQRAGRIWFDQDPHAQAYTSLLTEASAGIVSRLVNRDLNKSSQEYRDVLESKCVSCHASEKEPTSMRVLGADCQVCHGQTQAWSSEHYSQAWQNKGAQRFDNSLKLNVESLLSRAEICSSCHIGELQRQGLDREVDHRLLAAGHPPLHFDFETFLRRYPAHWDMKNEPIGHGLSKGFERWRVGKIVATMTRLKLLASRAQRDSRIQKDSTEVTKMHDWPELAEYSCSACHHSLAYPNLRNAQGASTAMRWDDWSLSQLESATRLESLKELKSRIAELKGHVEVFAPDRALVAASAESFRRWLSKERDGVSSVNENTSEIMLHKLRSIVEKKSSFQDWESAAQWYIAARLLSESLGIEGSLESGSVLIEDPFVRPTTTWTPAQTKQFHAQPLFQSGVLDRFQKDLTERLKVKP